MKKVLNEAMTKTIAKKMRRQLKEGTRLYSFYYYIFQEAIEEIIGQDELIKRIDIGKEFTEYINNVLSDMDYPSRYELDSISQSLINSLYDVFLECLESIIEDVKEEYTNIHIDTIDHYIAVVTTFEFNKFYTDDYYSKYYYSKERELIINDLKDVVITGVKNLYEYRVLGLIFRLRERIIKTGEEDFKISMTLEELKKEYGLIK